MEGIINYLSNKYIWSKNPEKNIILINWKDDKKFLKIINSYLENNNEI
jgi:hypothetical protein